MSGRDQKFWDFHKRKLGESAAGYSPARIAWAAVGLGLELALNPKSTVERLMNGPGPSHLETGRGIGAPKAARVEMKAQEGSGS